MLNLRENNGDFQLLERVKLKVFLIVKIVKTAKFLLDDRENQIHPYWTKHW